MGIVKRDGLGELMRWLTLFAGEQHVLHAVALNGRDCLFHSVSIPIDFRGGTARRCQARIVPKDGESRSAFNSEHWLPRRGNCRVPLQALSTLMITSSLELNRRLQVEHPVTEGITGVNMPWEYPLVPGSKEGD